MAVFTIAGIIGFIYEEICVYINDGVLSKRGTTFGPWIPIYGFGALLIFAVCHKVRHKPLPVFLISALVCGALELATGFVLDRFLGVRLWNYSVVILNWGNVNGYICLRSVITWGLFGLLLISAFLPLLEKFMRKHPRIFKISAAILFALFVLDITASLTIK